MNAGFTSLVQNVARISRGSMREKWIVMERQTDAVVMACRKSVQYDRAKIITVAMVVNYDSPMRACLRFRFCSVSP